MSPESPLSKPDHVKYRSPIPDKISPERARGSYKKLLQRYGAGRESQLNAYSDRHWNAQRIWKESKEQGLTREEAMERLADELGHDDPLKARYYVDISNF